MIETIELEQLIMTGVDQDFNELTPKQVFAQVKRFVEDHKSKFKEEVTRVVGLLVIHYSVPDKEFKSLSKALSV